MNLFIKQKQTHSYRTQTYGYQRGMVGGDKLGVWINRYTLLYIKQVINKDLLYSTENSAQYSVITYMGKEFRKEWICVYV